MTRLAPLEPEDYGRMVEWIDSPELLLQWGGTPFSFPLTEDQLRDHFEVDDGEPTRRGFKAVDDGAMIGTAELNRINREHDSAAISRVFVDPAERDRGVGTAMVGKVLAFGFEELDLHRISLRVFEGNEPAIACYETVGFVREGVHRDSHYFDGEYLTTVQMGILETEWSPSDGDAREDSSTPDQN